jgi:hypothetical protein
LRTYLLREAAICECSVAGIGGAGWKLRHIAPIRPGYLSAPGTQ